MVLVGNSELTAPLPLFTRLRDLNLPEHLRLGSFLCNLTSQVLLLTLLILHTGHCIVLPPFQVLGQSFEFNRLSLIVSILKQALGFLLRKCLLILQLHRFLILSLWISEVASIPGDRRGDSLQTGRCSRGWG